MSEKEKISDALKRDITTEWRVAALTAIDDQEVVFAGNANAGASNTVGDLLRIFRAGQSHCRERGIDAHGLAELIETLAGRNEGTVMHVQPFLGPRSSITAFWDVTGNLVGCVTILGRDSENGRRNLDFALG
jgi:hypothetical protein